MGPKTWLWIPLLFVAYCVARNLTGPFAERPLDRLLAVLSGFLGGIGTALALQAGVPFKLFAYAQVISGLCSVGVGWQGMGAHQPSGDEVVRFSGLIGNANELALLLGLGACLIWLFPRRSGVLACILAFLGVGFAVASTGSRKAILIVPAFLLLVAVQLADRVKKRRALVVVTAVLVLGVLGLILATTKLEALMGIGAIQRTVNYQDSSFELRSSMIEQGLKLWQTAPVFGRGFAAFEKMGGFGAYSHNNYVELLCNTGLAGLLLFYAIHFYILFRAARLSGPLRVYCVLFVLLLMVLDLGAIGHERKQTIVCLMILSSLATCRTGGVQHSNAVSRLGQRRFGAERVSPACRQTLLDEVES